MPTALEIEDARRTLAVNLNLLPGHLNYLGVQESALGEPALLLFNVDCAWHEQHNSTLSVRLAHAD